MKPTIKSSEVPVGITVKKAIERSLGIPIEVADDISLVNITIEGKPNSIFVLIKDKKGYTVDLTSVLNFLGFSITPVITESTKETETKDPMVV